MALSAMIYAGLFLGQSEDAPVCGFVLQSVSQYSSLMHSLFLYMCMFPLLVSHRERQLIFHLTSIHFLTLGQ